MNIHEKTPLIFITDGCFTLGAAVGAQIALMGHPFLAILAAMGAGILSGFVTGTLQTKFGINSLLAGIVVNTGLYSVNIAVMGGSSLLNMNKTVTVFTMMKGLLSGTPLASYNILIVALSAGMPMIRTFAERLKLLKDFWGHSSRKGYFSSKDGYAYQKEGRKTLKTCRKMSQFL